MGRIITLQLPEELAQLIERQAQRSGLDQSAIVIEALNQTLTLSLPPFSSTADNTFQQTTILEDWIAKVLGRLSEFRQISRLDETQAQDVENFERALNQFLSVLSLNPAGSVAPSGPEDFSRILVNNRLTALEQILSALPELVLVQDRVGRVIYANSASAGAFKTARSQLLGKAPRDLHLPQEILDLFASCHQEVLTAKRSVRGEMNLPTMQSTRVYEYIFSPVQSGGEEVDAVVFMARDLSERQQTNIELQQTKEMYRALFDAASDSILIIDLATGGLLNANWSAARHLGYSRRELLQLSISDIETPLDQGLHHFISQKLEMDGNALFEQVYRRKNGSEIPVEVSAQVIEYADRLAIQSFARDITDRKQAEAEIRALNTDLEQRVLERTAELHRINQELAAEIAERRRIETNLRRSETMLASAQRLAHVGSWEMDLQTQRFTWSEETYRIWGLAPAHTQPTMADVFQLIHPEDRDRVQAQVEASIANQTSYQREYRIIRSDGAVRYIESRGELAFDAEGRAVKLLGAVLDITDRKQTEESLRQSEQRYRAVVEEQTEFICRFRPDSTILFVNEAYCQYFGKSKAEFVGKSYQPEIFVDDRERVMQLVQSMTPEHPTLTIENRVVVNGEVRWTQWVNQLIVYDEEHTSTEYQSVGRDITQFKQAEIELRNKEEQLRLAVGLSQIGLWDWHIPTDRLIWNENAARLLGLPAAQLQIERDLLDWSDYLHPEDRLRVLQTITQALETHTQLEVEYRVIHPDGSIHWLLSKGHGIYNEAGLAIRMVGIALDISDHKQTELAFKQSEERYRAIVEDQTELISRSLPDGTLTFINEAYCRTFGRSREELIGRNLFQHEYEEDQQLLRNYFASFSPEKPIQTSEDRVVLADGSVRYYQWTDRAFFDAKGKVIEFQSVGRDITDRKQAEMALEQSEFQYRLLFQNHPNPIWIHDSETLAFLAVNQSAIVHYGYSESEFLAMTILDLCPSEDIDRLQKTLKTVSPTFYADTWRHLKKDDTLIDVEVDAHAITWAGKLARFVLVKDISDRQPN